LFFDSNRADKVSFELRELKIIAGDTVAFCHTLLIAGSAKKPQGRLTIGLKRVRGKWMIVHEHHSYPIKD
jgi:ketosteroid isomerase-like protein